MEKKSSLVTGSIGKGLLCFVVPLILSSLVQQLYITVDTIIVGQFAGKTALAAIDSVHTLFKFPINFMNGLAAGANIIISRHFGEKRCDRLWGSVLAAGLIAVVLGCGSSMVGAGISGKLVIWMQVPENINAQALSYTRIYFGGLWTLIIYNMAAGVLRSFGDSKSPLYILLMTSVVNIFGDLLLVAVFKWDVAGAAAATVFSQLLSAAMTVYLVYRKMVQMQSSSDVISTSADVSAVGVVGMTAEGAHTADHVALRDAGIRAMTGSSADMVVPRIPMDKLWRELAEMAVTGFPLALQSILFPVANTIVQAAVNSMGTDPIAAWGICDKLDMVIWLIADSMSPALTTYVAQNIGAGRADRVKKGVYIGAGMSVGAVAAVSLALFFLTGIMAAWFVPARDAALVVPLSKEYMQCMAPFFIFYAMAEAFSGACCGTGDTVKPMILTLIATCLLRVAGILVVLPRFENMGCIVGIYIASWIASGLCFTVLWILKSKKLFETSQNRTIHD